MATPPDPGDPAPVRPGRSVFDDAPADGPPSGAGRGRPEPLADEPLDDDAPAVPLTGVVEVEWDDWDDDEPGSRSRAPWIIGGLLLLAVVVVGALVVRAVNTDAELVLPSPTTAPDGVGEGAEPPADIPETPTLEALRASVPSSLTSCVPPPEPPTDGSVHLDCPRDDEPQLVTFSLYADRATRDRAFDAAVGGLELDPGAPGDCALADDVVHTYVGTTGAGSVACRTDGTRVDIIWTDAAEPILVTAGGNGRYSTQYRFWAELVGRGDAAFPLPLEQALLDELPPELVTRCRRDLDLTDQAGGVVAVACEPATGLAEVVSWVRFRDADAMTAWIEARQASLGDVAVDSSADACRPDGFGALDTALGVTSYEQAGSTGTILCFANSSDQNVLFWTRAGTNIGSIAVTDAGEGGIPMVDLLVWWEDGGHRP